MPIRLARESRINPIRTPTLSTNEICMYHLYVPTTAVVRTGTGTTAVQNYGTWQLYEICMKIFKHFVLLFWREEQLWSTICLSIRSVRRKYMFPYIIISLIKI